MSANLLTFITIVSHYSNNNSYLKTMLISFLSVIVLYLDKIIAKQIVQLIQKYKLKKKLEYYVLDNATSNDICIKAILKKL